MRALASTKGRDQEIKQQHRRIFMVLVYLASIVVAATAMGQKAKPDPKLKPRTVTLKTKDGIELRAFYFPSEKGKEAPTVLLVHEWQGQASPYGPLVLALSKAGCAVLVPDYRGHGDSKEFINALAEKDQFDLARMSRQDVEAIVTFDL